MEYLILGAIGIIILVFVFYLNKKGNKKKQLEEIQSSWGKPKLDSFDFNRISKYADTLDSEKFHRLSDQTIEDIDFYGLFEFIDRTSSKVGQQYLFKKLIEPTKNPVDPWENLIKLFTGDKQLRESIQLELSKLNNRGAYYITTLLKDKLLEKPKWFNLLILDIVILVVLLILSIKFPVLLLAMILFLTLNMFLHYWNKNNTFQFLRSFPQLNNLINVSKVLVKKGDDFSDNKIERSITDLKSFQQKVFLINLSSDNGIQSELRFVATYLIELIKAFFLVELFALYRITKELESKKSSIQNLFNYVGHIDTAISIASAKAILSYLNRNENIVIVATHDIELADLLAQEYDLYHFTETVENKSLHFDHTIKSGQLKTRNAIKILELSNYPADVIKEAQEISSSLGAGKF